MVRIIQKNEQTPPGKICERDFKRMGTYAESTDLILCCTSSVLCAMREGRMMDFAFTPAKSVAC